MKTTTALSLLFSSPVFFAMAGCAGDLPSQDETVQEDLSCGNAHHLTPEHFHHHHHRHHHPGHGGTTGGGTGSTTGGGTAGTVGGGTAGTTGGGTAGTMGGGSAGTMGGGSAGTMGGTAGTTGGGTGGTTGGGTGGIGPCTPPDGIVSWWHADDDFDDSVGSNDGANAGGVTFAPAEQLDGFVLNGGATSFVEVPNNPSLQMTSALTIDAWIKFSGGDGRIVDKVTAFSSDGYLLDMIGNQLRLFLGGDLVQMSSPITLGTWTHVAGTYDGTTMTLYVNGAMVATKATSVSSIPVGVRTLRIGADSNGNTLFSGMIDEPRVWSRALSAAEVQQVFTQGQMCP
jgi:hypothetical protein